MLFLISLPKPIQKNSVLECNSSNKNDDSAEHLFLGFLFIPLEGDCHP